MKKLLITGFEPFGGEIINPSWEAVKRLPDKVSKYELTKICIPVAFGDSTKMVIEQANTISADAILCIGQASGRNAITPELVAINIRHATIPDNNGNKPTDEKINSTGENAYFSTLPMRKIAQAINDNGISSHISYSAGAYVCNDLLYNLLLNYNNSNVKVGFIHVPYCKEQNKEVSMELDDIIKALIIAIENIDA